MGAVDIDQLTERTWKIWSELRRRQGFELGSVSAATPLEDLMNKRSPALVDNADKLSMTHRKYIEMWVRLVVGSMAPDEVTSTKAPSSPRAGLAVIMRGARDGDNSEALLVKVEEFRPHCPENLAVDLDKAANHLRQGEVVTAKTLLKSMWNGLVGAKKNRVPKTVTRKKTP